MMRFDKYERYSCIASLIIVAFMVQGCFGVRPAATKSGRSLYQTYYVGESGNQYFLKPMLFESEDDQFLTMDITFRYSNTFYDTATVNISFYSDRLIKELQSLSIENGTSEVSLSDFHRLYGEKQGKMIVSRYSCKAHMPSMSDLFKESSWKIIREENNNKITYSASKKTSKKLESLYQDLFTIL